MLISFLIPDSHVIMEILECFGEPSFHSVNSGSKDGPEQCPLYSSCSSGTREGYGTQETKKLKTNKAKS